jgi:hypothetical protein
MGKIILIIVLLASYLFNAQNIDKVKIGSSIISRDNIIIEFDKKDSIKKKKKATILLEYASILRRILITIKEMDLFL